jgi:hypothetical protein
LNLSIIGIPPALPGHRRPETGQQGVCHAKISIESMA